MRVVCRLRPPRDGDNGREAPVPLVFTSNAVYTFESGPRHSAYGRFDSALGPHATQDETFGACCGGLIDDCLRGVSATVLAYGASGAGKTHSLVGAVTTDLNGYHHHEPGGAPAPPRADSPGARDDAAALGVVPRAIASLVAARDALREQGPGGEPGGAHRCTEVEAHLSCFEVHRGRVFDLLQPAPADPAAPPPHLGGYEDRHLARLRERPLDTLDGALGALAAAAQTRRAFARARLACHGHASAHGVFCLRVKALWWHDNGDGSARAVNTLASLYFVDLQAHNASADTADLLALPRVLLARRAAAADGAAGPPTPGDAPGGDPHARRAAAGFAGERALALGLGDGAGQTAASAQPLALSAAQFRANALLWVLRRALGAPRSRACLLLCCAPDATRGT